MAEDSDDEEIAVSRSWHFTDDGPVTLICAQLPENQTGPLGLAVKPELYSATDICRH